jgi:oxygen-independent coproporphyrinogen-3 oxidase
VGATYSQNVKDLEAYYDAIDCKELSVARGVRLSMDDILRRSLIQTLMCQFELSIPAIELAFPVGFGRYFAPELARLRGLERDGLVTLTPASIGVTAKGRLLICNVCMVFDRHLARREQPSLHSRTV